MRARRTTLAAASAAAAFAVVLSLSVVPAARADTPSLSAPGRPVVVVNNPHQLTLSWEPPTWTGTPDTTEPIRYEVLASRGADTNVYWRLGGSDTNSITFTELPTGTEYRVSIQATGAPLSPATEFRTAYGRAKVSHRNLSGSATDNQVQPALQVTNVGTGPLDLGTVRVRYHLRTTVGEGPLVSVCDWAAMGCDTIRRTMTFLPPPAAPPGGPGGPPSPSASAPRPSIPPVSTAPSSSLPAGSLPSGNPAPSYSRSLPPSPTPTMYPNAGTPMPGYLELTFTGGSLAPGSSTGPIYLRLHLPSWAPHDERNDPSWRPAEGDWFDNSRITLDIDGVREFGIS